MSLVKSAFSVSLLVVFALSCFYVHATLDGDEIRIEYHFPTLGDVFHSDTVVVNSTLEVTCSAIGVGSGDVCDIDYGGSYTSFIDVGSNTISIGWNERGAFIDGSPFNGLVFADLDAGGDIESVTYQCMDESGGACVVEVITGNNDSELGDYVAVNFTDCTPVGEFGNCNPTSLTLFLEQSTDNDLDGVENTVDNCLDVANTAQTDTDEDGYGNACDADFNNDCVVLY